MDARTFLDNFGTIAEAPGGIDRLRELILELAVRGQLVQQRESEGIASELVEKLESERLRSSASKRPRRQIESVAGDEAPFTVPPTWAWVRLPAVSSDLGQGVPTQPFTYIDVGSIDNQAGSVGQTAVLSPEEAPSRARKSVARGSVVYSTVRPYLRNIAVIDRDFNPPAIASTAFAVYTPLPGVLPMWVFQCLRSPYFTSYVEAHQKGVAYPAINDGDMRRAPLPLPPTGEQERIVAKVDVLMQLCDDLEARQQTRSQVSGRLRASSLDALTTAATDDALRTAWVRMEKNWTTLVDHVDGVAAVRTAALQLAVEGRLTRRAAADGTAVEFLEELVPGLVERDPVDPSRVPYQVPSTWKWVHLENVCTHIVDCLHTTPRYVERGYPAIRTSDVEPGRILLHKARRVDEATFKERTSRLTVIAGDVVYSREGGRFGIAATVPPGAELCLGQRMMQFRCCPGLDPEYFTLFLNSSLGFGQASEDVGGSASPHVNIRAIRRFVFPLPPPAEQQRIVARVRDLEDACGQVRDDLIRLDGIGEALARSLTASTT